MVVFEAITDVRFQVLTAAKMSMPMLVLEAVTCGLSGFRQIPTFLRNVLPQFLCSITSLRP
jgi:hypothetical protein